MVIAAAGFHNLLMIGRPGAGKTMAARRLGGIMPPMREEEQLEVLKLMIAECAAEFERLPLVRDVEILRSVLYSGVWTQYAMKLKKEKGGAVHGQ